MGIIVPFGIGKGEQEKGIEKQEYQADADKEPYGPDAAGEEGYS
jgi:hypothetical protein